MISNLLSYFMSPPTAARPRSSRWPEVRAAHLRREPECQCCETRAALEVHHLIPYHIFPARELDATNLLTLCDRCHLFVGHLGAWASWNPSCRADAVAWRDKIQHRPKA